MRATVGVGLRPVVLAGYYPPPMGGEGLHISELAQRLRTHGVPVKILNLRRGAPPSAEYRAIARRVDFLTALCESLVPGALLHLHTNCDNRKSCLMVVVAAMVLRMRGATGLLTLHSGLAPGYLLSLNPASRSLVRLGIASFAHVICVNAKIREAVAGLGVQTDRLSVIPAYLGIRATAPLTEADQRMLSAFTPLVATIGGREPEWYGLPIVVDAVARLSAHFPRLGCIVIGSGGDAALRRLIAERGLEDRVLCLGEVAHERCLALLARADVYVRPSYIDGDASSVREALALGVPVVATDTDFRPAGVLLCRRGDVQDLAEKVARALHLRLTGDWRSRCEDAGAQDRLLDVYERVGIGPLRSESGVAAAGFARG
ncbi:MAG: glycosyltransferase [Candidatus Rokubacteria bacterium]|nr:glycosyltransferase [Candidatus Rokubacteria bacterium]